MAHSATIYKEDFFSENWEEKVGKVGLSERVELKLMCNFKHEVNYFFLALINDIEFSVQKLLHVLSTPKISKRKGIHLPGSEQISLDKNGTMPDRLDAAKTEYS